LRGFLQSLKFSFVLVPAQPQLAIDLVLFEEHLPVFSDRCARPHRVAQDSNLSRRRQFPAFGNAKLIRGRNQLDEKLQLSYASTKNGGFSFFASVHVSVFSELLCAKLVITFCELVNVFMHSNKNTIKANRHV